MWNETLEKKCKYYQEISNFKLMPGGYLILHLDGRSFSKFVKTQKFKTPFDEDFISIMNNTLSKLCPGVGNCKLGFVQSDEMTLICYDEGGNSDIWLGNRISKICSLTAALASSIFIKELLKLKIKSGKVITEELLDKLTPTFDCKAWAVPNKNEAYAWLSFRSLDCAKNSVQMVARSVFSHKELNKLHMQEQINKLKEEKNIDWHSIDEGQKYGRLCSREGIEVSPGVIRNKWTIKPGVYLAGKEGKEKFDELELLK